jgi:DNA-directed RNA polymerase specialized sigma24 family protein
MLINNASFRDEVRRIVSGFTKNSALQEDLLQEAMIHAWRVETEKPDRTRSWYLQSCRFHLQHWLALGRSVDSLKRVTVDTCVLVDEDELHEYHTNGECFESVSFHDLVLTLSLRLRPAENGVLQGLANGMRLREIARAIGLSYPTALKYRRKIAELVSRLELSPVSAGTRWAGDFGTISRPANKPRRRRSCSKAAPTPDATRKIPVFGTARHDRSSISANASLPKGALSERRVRTYLRVLAVEDATTSRPKDPLHQEPVAVC